MQEEGSDVCLVRGGTLETQGQGIDTEPLARRGRAVVKAWPRWASQRLHVTSTRVIP